MELNNEQRSLEFSFLESDQIECSLKGLHPLFPFQQGQAIDNHLSSSTACSLAIKKVSSIVLIPLSMMYLVIDYR